jgi:hypothetical protein
VEQSWIRDSADPKEVEKYQQSPNPDEFRMNQMSYILSFRAEDIMTVNPVTIDVGMESTIRRLLRSLPVFVCSHRELQ